MKLLPAPPEATEITGDYELDRGLLLLAEEIALSGKAGDPETPAFIRRLLGRPINIEEPKATEFAPPRAAPVSTKPFLRAKRASDGTNRYELVFPPKNDPVLLAWSRICRRMDRMKRQVAYFAERRLAPRHPAIASPRRPALGTT